MLKPNFYQIVVSDIIVALHIKTGTTVMEFPAGSTTIEIFEGLQRWDSNFFSYATSDDTHTAPSKNIKYFLIVIIHQSDIDSIR